jgi:phage gpG-like protein
MSQRGAIEIDMFGQYASDVTSDLATAPLNDSMERARAAVLQDIRDAFTSGRSPQGAGWPPRKKEGDGHPLLMDTGALLQAATGGGPGHISNLQEREMTVGVRKATIPYAAVHQYGFPGPDKLGRMLNIPARPYHGATDESLDAIGEDIAEELLQVF